tara:strand:- start:343 stop:600 length:258 start_codon:yes stop_codon:yes gene_type:complete
MSCGLKEVLVMNYQIVIIHPRTHSERLLGIYATEKAAEFIKSKLESRNRDRSVEYVIEPTKHSLRPETSHKVDKYLLTLFVNQPA